MERGLLRPLRSINERQPTHAAQTGLPSPRFPASEPAASSSQSSLDRLDWEELTEGGEGGAAPATEPAPVVKRNHWPGPA